METTTESLGFRASGLGFGDSGLRLRVQGVGPKDFGY